MDLEEPQEHRENEASREITVKRESAVTQDHREHRVIGELLVSKALLEAVELLDSQDPRDSL